MQGWRKTMEDAHICDISQGEGGRFQVFGVFDGHGGREIAQFVKEHFTKELLSNYHLKKGKIKTALKETFVVLDRLLSDLKSRDEIAEYARNNLKAMEENDKKYIKNPTKLDKISKYFQPKPEDELSFLVGCTCCVCVIDNKDKKMYFANAGDSRVMLCKKGKAIQKSFDHKPDLPAEKNRILYAGGQVIEGRINGEINLSRGIGDLEFKYNSNLPMHRQMMISEPEIIIDDLDEDCDFIVIGCDGIWECLNCDQVCEEIKEQKKKEGKLSENLGNILDKICPEKIESDDQVGCDNMTILLVDFKKQ